MRAGMTWKAVAAVALVTVLGAAPAQTEGSDPARDGVFLAPFAEPTAGGVPTDAVCVEAEDGSLDCKPTAGSLAVLASGPGDLLYFNALEGTENVRFGIAAEFGTVSINAQARRMDISGTAPSWQPTFPVDGGGDPDGHAGETLLPNGIGNTSGSSPWNDASLFCADLTLRADGKLVAVGGTSYYQEPGIDGVPLGVVELEGMRSTRLYDPDTNSWAELPSMNHGRWYPSMVTLGDGSSFVASGVTKLLKPVYPERPLDSGRNVVQTEISDPTTGEWTLTGDQGDRSLPLFPRLHLLPNGEVLYNAAGQVFNPAGQAYDEALWNLAASYDPAANRWVDIGVPGALSTEDGPDLAAILPQDPAATFEEALARGQDAATALADGLQEMDLGPGIQGALGLASSQGLEGLGHVLGSGFRGSTFSIMLPLEPDADGGYRAAEFLTAGGIVGVTPGTYVPVPFSRIDRYDTTGDAPVLTSRPTGSFDTARWYSTGVALPTGEVLALNGSTADEVVGPGSGFPVTQAELFDPVTETWRPVAHQGQERVYHSSAALLPDGRVLVGGHDQISTLYGNNTTLPGGASPSGRDPTFEIYEPPYLHYGVDQPRILQAPDTVPADGHTFRVVLDVAAGDIESVSLVRNTTITHLVDGDQRNVRLPVVARKGNVLTVQAPPDGNVAPPGPYLLFANRSTDQGPVPSVAAQVTVPFGGVYAEGEPFTHERPDGDPGLTPLVPNLGDDPTEGGDEGGGEGDDGSPAAIVPTDGEGSDGVVAQAAPARSPAAEELRARLLATPVAPVDRTVPIAVAVLTLACSAAVLARARRQPGGG